MAANLWILVANDCRATLYETTTDLAGDLRPTQGWEHPETRAANVQRRTVGQGQTTERHPEEEPMSGRAEPTAPRTVEIARFAQEIANFLNTAKRFGTFEDLVIIATGELMNRLFERIDANVNGAVRKELVEDLTEASTDEIAGHLRARIT